MDASVILCVPDNILREEYGLYARGDIHALRSFCESRASEEKIEKNEDKKRELIYELIKGKSERSKVGKKSLSQPVM